MQARKDLELCGEACNSKEAIQKSLQLNPHLIILDITMPVLDGFSATKKIKELLPKISILMLLVHDGPHLANNSQLVGAQGFVTKS